VTSAKDCFNDCLAALDEVPHCDFVAVLHPDPDGAAAALGALTGGVIGCRRRAGPRQHLRAHRNARDEPEGHPAAVVSIVSGIDRDAHISTWDCAVRAASDRGATPPYETANATIRVAGRTAYGTEAEACRRRIGRSTNHASSAAIALIALAATNTACQLPVEALNTLDSGTKIDATPFAV